MEGGDLLIFQERFHIRKMKEKHAGKEKILFNKLLLNTYFCARHKGYKDERDVYGELTYK